ncbi:hypothetical protein RSAG8_13405, partial [Rhizoctonia solani AG-8 WAC10335]
RKLGLPTAKLLMARADPDLHTLHIGRTSHVFMEESGVGDPNSTSTRRTNGGRNQSNFRHLAHKRVVVGVTQDGETYSTVDLTGSTDAQTIRSRILSKLDIPDHLRPDYGIFHTELGDLATGGPALDDDQLLDDFQCLTNKSGRHFFVQHLWDVPSSPASETGIEIGSDTEEPNSDSEGAHKRHLVRVGRKRSPELIIIQNPMRTKLQIRIYPSIRFQGALQVMSTSGKRTYI